MEPERTSYSFQYRIFSECGPRWKNEDSIDVVDDGDKHNTLFILCDGMGGHRHGDVASKIIVDSFGCYWRQNRQRPLCREKIIEAAEHAMGALNEYQFLGMGTTMALVAIEGRRLFTAHCGDSRIYYCFRGMDDGQLIAAHLRDHIARTPEGWLYVDKGFIQKESNYIPEIHEFKMRLNQNDRFLICSDGVYEAFKEREIEELMKVSISIDDLTNSLRERCERSARDNYSAIVIEIE